VGLRDWFTRSARSGPARSSGSGPLLFDDDFQRKLEMLSLVSRRVVAGRTRAERRSSKKGSGVEFADHRNYVPGDDIRFVDWNVYQRFGRLLVRLFEEQEDLSVYFLVDTSASMGFGDGLKFDQARRLAAALAYVALAHLDRVTMVSVGAGQQQRMPTTRGKARIFQVLDFLRRLESAGETNLEDSMKTFVAQHKRRGVAVLLSDLYDPAGFEAAINVLRFNRFEPYVVHLVDTADGRPAIRGDVRLTDCESGAYRDATISSGIRARFARAWAEYQQGVEHFCGARHVPYFAADVETPFDDLVLRVFRQGGFLR
jgi:uncharacterized protein (DUF58 family)